MATLFEFRWNSPVDNLPETLSIDDQIATAGRTWQLYTISGVVHSVTVSETDYPILDSLEVDTYANSVKESYSLSGAYYPESLWPPIAGSGDEGSGRDNPRRGQSPFDKLIVAIKGGTAVTLIVDNGRDTNSPAPWPVLGRQDNLQFIVTSLEEDAQEYVEGTPTLVPWSMTLRPATNRLQAGT